LISSPSTQTHGPMADLIFFYFVDHKRGEIYYLPYFHKIVHLNRALCRNVSMKCGMKRMSFQLMVARKYIANHDVDLLRVINNKILNKFAIKSIDFLRRYSFYCTLSCKSLIYLFIYLPFELTMPSNGWENVKCTSMWSFAHITSNETIFGIPFGRSDGHNSFPADTKLNWN
jgi:hypothetical protein